MTKEYEAELQALLMVLSKRIALNTGSTSNLLEVVRTLDVNVNAALELVSKVTEQNEALLKRLEKVESMPVMH